MRHSFHSKYDIKKFNYEFTSLTENSTLPIHNALQTFFLSTSMTNRRNMSSLVYTYVGGRTGINGEQKPVVSDYRGTESYQYSSLPLDSFSMLLDISPTTSFSTVVTKFLFFLNLYMEVLMTLN